MIMDHACRIRDDEHGMGSARLRSKSIARSAPLNARDALVAQIHPPARLRMSSSWVPAPLHHTHARSHILRSATFLGISDSTAVYLGIAPVAFIIFATLGWCAFCHTLRAPRSADADEMPSRDGLDLRGEDALPHASKSPYDMA
jgi:hypothetical protein